MIPIEATLGHRLREASPACHLTWFPSSAAERPVETREGGVSESPGTTMQQAGLTLEDRLRAAPGAGARGHAPVRWSALPDRDDRTRHGVIAQWQS